MIGEETRWPGNSLAREFVMGIWLSASGLLCGLGTAVFAAAAAQRRTNLAVGLVSVVLTLGWSGFELVPRFGTLGLGIAVAAGFRIFRPAWNLPVAVLAGILPGVWIGLLAGEGLPLVAAVVAALGTALVSAFLARSRPAFAPESLIEDAMLALGVLALLVAAGPTMADGWRTAQAINLPYASRSTALHAFFIVTTILAAAAGGGYTLWWRNR